jgi:EAL and modified HD-GYP domain-containing signal transduction protein
MKTFLARQPIMNSKNDIVGYEFLFRNSKVNNAVFSDAYDATLKVTHDLLINFGINKVSGGKRFFINFKPIHLHQKLPDFFKSEALTIELVNYEDACSDLINILKKYKLEGYLIALDDFNLDMFDHELLEQVDFIKIDCLKFELSVMEEMVTKLKKYNKTLIAKKIEDYKQYNLMRKLGFDLFQGYYFKKPCILTSDETESIPKVYTELLNELNATEIDFSRISDLIKKDIQLSLNFLKLINSVGYYSRERVKSLDRAVIRLGADESRKIILVNLLKKMLPMKNTDQLLKKSILRGKQAEVLAVHFGLEDQSGELFILGIFSLLNIITGESMKSILSSVPLSESVEKSLLGERNELTNVLETIILFERRAMERLESQLKVNNISIDIFNKCYIQALSWVDDLSII